MMADTRRSPTSVFLFPVLIALIVLAGLVSALIGDGIWDAVSWVALAVPLAVIVLFFQKGSPHKK